MFIRWPKRKPSCRPVCLHQLVESVHIKRALQFLQSKTQTYEYYKVFENCGMYVVLGNIFNRGEQKNVAEKSSIRNYDTIKEQKRNNGYHLSTIVFTGFGFGSLFPIPETKITPQQKKLILRAYKRHLARIVGQ